MSDQAPASQPNQDTPKYEEVSPPKVDFGQQLSAAVSMAAKEDQIAWAIFGVFWAANAVLLVALFTTGGPPGNLVGIVVSATGAVVSWVWFLIQRRTLAWLAYYEEIIWRLEKDHLGVPEDVALSAWINKTTFRKCVGEGVRVRPLMLISGAVGALLWTVGVILFVCRGAAQQ